MRISKLVGERVKEEPAGATVRSQSLLMRAGFIKQVNSGIYSLLPPAQRISAKIQQIIREEMNRVDGQEVLLPVVMPKELWEESGRYYSIGEEMIRFKDRNNHDMLLGMTHEEAAVHLAKNTVKSYDSLPCMIYQIQTKFRDEARPRAGLIRVKEFTMKDAYSFHETQEDLNDYYQKLYDAYFRIYKRIGLKNVIAVGSDSGMMGGSVAHEYMLLTPIGEDTIAICDTCNYKANVEIATGKLDSFLMKEEPVKEVYTGAAKTIEEVCKFLKIEACNTCKAVCYAISGNNEKSVIVFTRGDLEVNEAKLRAYLKCEVAPKDLDETSLIKGNIGAYKLDNPFIIKVFDKSLEGMTNLVMGANKEGYHLTDVSMPRDFKDAKFVDVTKVIEGEGCPCCNDGHLHISNGIEVGNIFQLGTKYTKAMNMKVHGRSGEEFNPIMGCYGIGVGRALASVAEESSDEKGLCWPVTIAPWQVYLCPIRMDNEDVLNKAEKLYSELISDGIEVIYDDRTTSAGVKLTDSELMGIPVRIVISPKTIADDECEITIRKTGEKKFIKLNDTDEKIEDILRELKNEIEGYIGFEWHRTEV